MKTIPIFYEMDVNSPTKEHLFYIGEVMHSLKKDEASPPTHRHPFFEILFLKEGTGYMEIDFKKYPIERGASYFFSASQIHCAHTTGMYKGFLLRFDVSIFHDKAFFDCLSIFDFNFLLLHAPDYSIIMTMLENLQDEYIHERSLKQYTINNLLNLLLIKIQRLLPPVMNNKSHTSLFASFNKAIVDNNYKNLPQTVYTKKLKIATPKLNKLVKEYTGLSCGEYLRSKTITEAKRLLGYSKMSIKEIALSLGFEDPAYFCRFFKRETTVSPVQFRNSIKN